MANLGSSNLAVVSASSLGCTNDCNLDTGLTVGGGAPSTGNAAIINAWLLSQAQSTTALELILDVACMLNAAIVIPSGANVAIRGTSKKYSGFFMAQGANSPCITTKLGAPFEPQTTPPTQSGSLTLERFRIEGNRGNGTTGNSSSGNFHGITGPTGDFDPATNYYSNLDLCNLASLTIRDVHSANAPVYQARVTNCSNVVVDGYTGFYPSTGTNGYNQDGFHCSGPVSNVRLSKLYVWLNPTTAGYCDDAVCFNAPEGYGGNVLDAVVSDSVLYGLTLCRVYAGSLWTASKILFTNFTGYAVNSAFCLGVQTGLGTTTGGAVAIDQIKDFTAQNGVVSMGALSFCFAQLCHSVGRLSFKGMLWRDPLIAVPLIALANNQTMNVSLFELAGFTVYRTTVGSALAGAIFDSQFNAGGMGTTNVCNFKRIMIDGYTIADEAGQSFSPIPFLFRVATGSIAEIWIESLESTNITAFADATYGFTNIAKIAGPGVATCGFQFPDTVMAVNTPYISATGANAGKLCIQHTAGTVIAIA